MISSGIDIITKITFHGLRDTHASLLFAKDISLDVISERLGHSSIRVTMDHYIDLLPEKSNPKMRLL